MNERDSIKQRSAEKWHVQKNLREEQKRDLEEFECTFRPQIRRKLIPTPNRSKSGAFSPKISEKGYERILELEQRKQDKEVEDCTFAPSVNSELNRDILRGTRPSHFSDTLLKQNDERLRRRLEREKRVMEEEYPFQPKLRRTSLSKDADRAPIHERLHRAYTASYRRGVEQSSRERSVSSHDVELRPKKCRPSATSELLYSDALERRERAKERAQKAEKRNLDGLEAVPHVLASSRRYHWSLLEKQVKEAFDFAVEEGREQGRQAADTEGM